MNKQKQLYEAPEAETFVVRTEGMLCQSNPLLYGNPGEAGDGFGDGGSYDF